MTTGEWAGTLREVFGEFRAPTGVGEARRAAPRPRTSRRCARRSSGSATRSAGGRKILVGKPGLDGHSNGAEQIAVARPRRRLRRRLRGHPPDARADRGERARRRASTSSACRSCRGSHRELVPLVLDALRERGVDAPVVVGGIIPEADVEPLRAAGVAAVYTPKDFDLTRIMRDIVALVAERNGVKAAA